MTAKLRHYAHTSATRPQLSAQTHLLCYYNYAKTNLIIWYHQVNSVNLMKFSIRVMSADAFLQNKGGYRNLVVYRISEVIYDVTYYFTQSYLKKGDRTIDQMVQAARSGKQNIAEGSVASTTSAETEIKLTNVAKASLEELLIDYEDYLRVRGLERWNQGHLRYARLREFCKSDSVMKYYSELLPRLNDEEICNMCITLINQATYMLRKLIERQQRMFLENGGVREQMSKARIEYRNKKR